MATATIIHTGIGADRAAPVFITDVKSSGRSF